MSAAAVAERYRVVNDGTDVESWLHDRKGFIGASQSAAILGLNPHATALDVWKSMQPDAEPFPDNRFTTWGKRLESVVADWAQVDFPDILPELAPSPGLLASLDYPFLSCTPDRELVIDGVVSGLVEIKTGSEYTKDNWWEKFTGKPAIPTEYEVQTVQQLYVRGLDYGYVEALIGGNDLLAPRLVNIDHAFMDILLETLANWYEKYYVGQTPPPATYRDDLKSLYPGNNGMQIDASPEIMKLVAERNEMQPKMAEQEKRDKILKGTIQAFMGDATELIDPDSGKTVVTWNRGVKERQVFDETQFAIDHPDLYRAYRKSKAPGRTMLFK